MQTLMGLPDMITEIRGMLDSNDTQTRGDWFHAQINDTCKHTYTHAHSPTYTDALTQADFDWFDG